MDRILVFDTGRIVEDGTPAELMAREGGLYRALRERQALAAEAISTRGSEAHDAAGSLALTVRDERAL